MNLKFPNSNNHVPGEKDKEVRFERHAYTAKVRKALPAFRLLTVLETLDKVEEQPL